MTVNQVFVTLLSLFFGLSVCLSHTHTHTHTHILVKPIILGLTYFQMHFIVKVSFTLYKCEYNTGNQITFVNILNKYFFFFTVWQI